MKTKPARPVKTGRPLATVDEAQVITLAKINCTYEEIAAVVGCSTDTLKRRFADCIEKGREEGKASLRRIQFTTALKGNATMQIWLGKQYLAQTDKSDVTIKDPSKMSDAELEAERAKLQRGTLKLA